MRIDAAYWWERAIVCAAALERNPADKLAYREFMALAKVKDRLQFMMGDLGLALLGTPDEHVEV